MGRLGTTWCLLFLLITRIEVPQVADILPDAAPRQHVREPAASAVLLPGTIPPAFFGMTVKDASHIVPSVPYGTTRSWDGAGLAWADLNPSSDHYNFASLDKFISRNQARGTDTIYTFGRTPRWASSQPDAKSPYGAGQCAPPADLSSWDHFVTAIATHAAGRIIYWELWNEPNNPEMWCAEEHSSATVMETMAEHAYRILKAISPASVILSPSVTGRGGPAWLQWYLSVGGGNQADIIAFHGYWSHQAEDLVSVVARYRQVMSANQTSGKPLWDTESSWANWDSDGSITIPLPKQVSFVAKSYLLHWSQGVSRFVWYAWDGDLGWGAMDTLNETPNPVAEAYRQTYTWMVGAILSEPCSKGLDHVWACTLTRAGNYSAKALWISDSQTPVKLPNKYINYIDLAGGLHPITDHIVVVGDQPILVETERPKDELKIR